MPRRIVVTYQVVFSKGPRPDKVLKMQHSASSEEQAVSIACALIAQGGCLTLHIEDDDGRMVLTEREIMARCK